MSLSSTGLPIGEDGTVIPLEDLIDNGLDKTFVDICLGGVRTEDIVVGEGFLGVDGGRILPRAGWGGADDLATLDGTLEDCPLADASLAFVERAATDCNLNVNGAWGGYIALAMADVAARGKC